MKLREVWEANDGQLFHSKKDCEAHEDWQEVVKSFEPIYGNTLECRVDFPDFNDWAEEHRDWLAAYTAAKGIGAES